MSKVIKNNHEVSRNEINTVVWVNSPQGVCVARFNKSTGYEVFDSCYLEEPQYREMGPMVFCHWRRFRIHVKNLHAVLVPYKFVTF